jgi:hypothetical protein
MKYEVNKMKNYESPIFDVIKYNESDILTISDNKMIDATDPSGFGGQTDID